MSSVTYLWDTLAAHDSKNARIVNSLIEHVDELALHYNVPVLFASISGSHLYGFNSPDSDYDLRGIFVAPLDTFLGLQNPREVIEATDHNPNLEVDLVLFDVKKFVQLMLAGNGNVLEQIYSPLRLLENDRWIHELEWIAKQSLNRKSGYHYLGFADTILKQFQTTQRVKQLLYVFRTLLTGLYLLEEGTVLSHLPTLIEHYGIWRIDELIQMKTHGTEKMELDSSAIDNYYIPEINAIRDALQDAIDDPTDDHSILPRPDDSKLIAVRAQAQDFLIRVRKEMDGD